MIERIELDSDALGHTLDVWYGGPERAEDGWRTIESGHYDFLREIALALAEREGLVRVSEREWRKPEARANGLDLDVQLPGGMRKERR